MTLYRILIKLELDRRHKVKVFVEYGLDFDNNRYGLGRSVEIENSDGTESRCKDKFILRNRRYYIRIWIGKKVFSYSRNNGFKITLKNRNNIKILLGYEADLDK